MNKDWTVEIHRLDRRYKEGMVLWSKTDFTDMTLDAVERANPRRPGFIVKIFETYVTRRNAMTGQDLLGWMSESEVERFARANEYLFTDEE